MALLLYGVTQSSDAEIDLPTGVAGSDIQKTEMGELICFFSEHSTLAEFKALDAALEFYRAVNCVFAARDLIPFRFPTVMADRVELQQQLQAHAAEYANWLAGVRGLVQMEVRITYRNSVLPGQEQRQHNSGIGYLRERQTQQANLQSAAAEIRERTRNLTKGWRQRESSAHLRCFMLVNRESVAEFRYALTQTTISSELLARVSGPWPATEFFGKTDNGGA